MINRQTRAVAAISDENGQPSSHSVKQLASSANHHHIPDARPRHALGVIPAAALNAQQHTAYQKQQQLQQAESTHQHPPQQQINHPKQRSKIPVLVDVNKQKHTSEKSHSVSTFDDLYPYYYTNEPMYPRMTKEIKREINAVYAIYGKSLQKPDPEDEDTFDTSMVAEYSTDIFGYMHLLETKYQPDPRYLSRQAEIGSEQRTIVLNWLVDLHGRFHLLPETLFLAVNILDRFSTLRSVSLSRYQLLAAVSLFIAAKYEEIHVPTVSQMVSFSNGEFDRATFMSAELFVCNVLNFEFGSPGPMSFLRRGSKADGYESNIRTLAKYFLEVAMMDWRLIGAPSSWIAAGAQYLSRQLLGKSEWTDKHILYTGYTVEQLAPLSDILEQCCLDYKNHHPSVYNKYAENCFLQSAVYVQRWLKEHAKKTRIMHEEEEEEEEEEHQHDEEDDEDGEY